MSFFKNVEAKFYVASLISSIKSLARQHSLALIPAFLFTWTLACCGVKAEILCPTGFSNTFIWSVNDSQRLRLGRKGIAVSISPVLAECLTGRLCSSLLKSADVFNISHGRKDLFIYLLSPLIETCWRLEQIVLTVLVMHFLRRLT